VDAAHVRIGADATVASFVVLSPGTVVSAGEIVTPFSNRSH
jgi:acetyltransferase-like isoleucine patch superfamily enzyme